MSSAPSQLTPVISLNALGLSLALAWFAGHYLSFKNMAGCWGCVAGSTVIWALYEAWDFWLMRTADLLFSPNTLGVDANHAGFVEGRGYATRLY